MRVVLGMPASSSGLGEPPHIVTEGGSRPKPLRGGHRPNCRALPLECVGRGVARSSHERTLPPQASPAARLAPSPPRAFSVARLVRDVNLSATSIRA
jgi:hypothetical protein